MIIDSHCHLNYEPMSLSLKETIQRANNDGVKYLLTISTEDKSFNKVLNIISNILTKLLSSVEIVSKYLTPSVFAL